MFKCVKRVAGFVLSHPHNCVAGFCFKSSSQLTVMFVPDRVFPWIVM